MENYRLIEDQIKDMSDEQIVPMTPNCALPILLIVAGVVLAVLGIVGIASGTVNTILIVLGIIIAIIAIPLLVNSSKEHYIYKPTGKKFKKYTVFLSENDFHKVADSLREQNFNFLKNIQKEMNAKAMLTVMAPEDGSIALAQLFEYIPYNYEPRSPVYTIKGNNAKLILDFCKS